MYITFVEVESFVHSTFTVPYRFRTFSLIFNINLTLISKLVFFSKIFMY